jgi:hypothetical protein
LPTDPRLNAIAANVHYVMEVQGVLNIMPFPFPLCAYEQQQHFYAEKA